MEAFWFHHLTCKAQETISYWVQDQFQYQYLLSRYGDFHYKDTTAVRLPIWHLNNFRADLSAWYLQLTYPGDTDFTLFQKCFFSNHFNHTSTSKLLLQFDITCRSILGLLSVRIVIEERDAVIKYGICLKSILHKICFCTYFTVWPEWYLGWTGIVNMLSQIPNI